MATWGQLRDLYLSAIGDNAAGREERWTHLTKGFRQVTVDPDVDIPELAAIDESLVIAAGADYAEMSGLDFTVFALLNVFNKTDGVPLNPEPGGMEGRARYLDTTGKPPSGAVTHYMRDGTKLYVRNTPSVETTLSVRARRQITALTDADISSTPLTPPQYDHAIVYFAVGSFYALHPKMSGEGLPIREDERYNSMGKAEILRVKHPRQVEDKVRRETMRLRGYSMSPRSRW